jgi:acetyl-CoA decarbonylase/synthase complex subunit delta
VVKVGGENTMPFMLTDGEMPNPPRIAIEIADRRPTDWSPLLLEAWGDVVDDPAKWAKAAEEGRGRPGAPATLPDARRRQTHHRRRREGPDARVLQATGLPILVFGPGQVDADNELLVAVAEEAAGERIVLGICEEKNYRTIVAAALANGHLVNGRTAMDVNLAKQLNILIADMGLPLDRIMSWTRRRPVWATALSTATR